MPRAFITGITGQDGSYLAELLLDKGEVHIKYGAIRDAAFLDDIERQVDELLERRSEALVDIVAGAYDDDGVWRGSSGWFSSLLPQPGRSLAVLLHLGF